jgi:guanylate kinase
MSSDARDARHVGPGAAAPARGILLVVSSPSGAGKSTLCKRLRREFPELGFSVSYTTRAPRHGETDGVEYNFVDRSVFQEMVSRDEFAEYALVHDNMYGTAAKPVLASLEGGHDLLFDIDFQGSRQLHQRFPDDVVRVFVLPPSLDELAQRLRKRNTDAPEVIERRLRMAERELAHYDEYEYLIVNDDLDRAYDALRAVYLAQLHRVARQKHAAIALLERGVVR